MEGMQKAYQTVADMEKKILELHLRLPSRPLRIDLDPEFDLFRRLDRREIPPAVSLALGAKKMLILLPSFADRTILGTYRGFAEMLAKSGPDHVTIKLDREVKYIPWDRAVIILGWENLFARKTMNQLEGYGVSLGNKAVSVGKAEFPIENHSAIFVEKNPNNKDVAVVFIASGSPEALPGLGRKLPHYHKYSYLVFEGNEPVNILKGRWPIVNSPMTAFLPGKEGVSKVGIGELRKREPLIK